MIDYLITILIMSLVCCGLTVITEKGMLLYFVRNPFDKIEDEIKQIDNHLLLHGEFPTRDLWEYERRKNKFILNLFKPIILCCTCMASLWGGISYILIYNGINILIIPAIIATAFLNSVFISYYYSKA